MRSVMLVRWLNDGILNYKFETVLYLCDDKQVCIPEAHSSMSAHLPLSGISWNPSGHGLSELSEGVGIGWKEIEWKKMRTFRSLNV